MKRKNEAIGHIRRVKALMGKRCKDCRSVWTYTIVEETESGARNVFLKVTCSCRTLEFKKAR